jgi:NAD(P)-dependent dehydrogenase (short-subunit alcohol dehydrogenase family)
MSGRFVGKKVLVTCVDRYMGAPIAKGFEAEGAEVITDKELLKTQTAVDELQARVGDIDILIANFADDPRPNKIGKLDPADWESQFETMVYPLMRTINSFASAMQAQGQGKIVAMTSAAPLRGIPKFSTYCSARGAQNAFVRAAGLELAAHNIQFNAIAQNYVKNERYFPDELIESEAFKAKVLPHIPTGKVAEEEETAELAMYLASDKCTHMVGQVLPWAGGWATTTG